MLLLVDLGSDISEPFELRCKRLLWQRNGFD